MYNTIYDIFEITPLLSRDIYPIILTQFNDLRDLANLRILSKWHLKETNKYLDNTTNTDKLNSTIIVVKNKAKNKVKIWSTTFKTKPHYFEFQYIPKGKLCNFKGELYVNQTPFYKMLTVEGKLYVRIYIDAKENNDGRFYKINNITGKVDFDNDIYLFQFYESIIRYHVDIQSHQFYIYDTKYEVSRWLKKSYI